MSTVESMVVFGIYRLKCTRILRQYGIFSFQIARLLPSNLAISNLVVPFFNILLPLTPRLPLAPPFNSHRPCLLTIVICAPDHTLHLIWHVKIFAAPRSGKPIGSDHSARQFKYMPFLLEFSLSWVLMKKWRAAIKQRRTGKNWRALMCPQSGCLGA